MGKANNEGQALAITASFAVDTFWDKLPVDVLQLFIQLPPKERGERFTAFLKNGGRVIIGELNSLKIDRSEPFNPTTFIAPGVTIWRGPKGGNGLEGEEEQDARSLVSTEISPVKLGFEHMLKDGESSITGEEKLKRHLVAKHILADAKIGQTLFEEPGKTTLEWLHKTFGVTWMEFPGTTLHDSDGDRNFLYLYRCGGGRWGRGRSWLDIERGRRSVSVVLAGSTFKTKNLGSDAL